MDQVEWDSFRDRLRRLHRGDGVSEHGTANPTCAVRHKVRIVGVDAEYAEETVYIDLDNANEVYGTIDEFLENLDSDQITALNHLSVSMFDCGIKDLCEYDLMRVINRKGYSLKEVGYIDRWEIVNVHFTAEGAQAFIDRQRHNYNGELGIWINSSIWCDEFNSVIQAILDGQVQFNENYTNRG
jgi:hypothetical protein